MGSVTLRPRAAGAFVLLACAAAISAACDDSAVTPETTASGDPVESVLRSDRELVFGCYEQRVDDPTFIDRVPTRVAFAAGDTAVDFTLRDTGGAQHRLLDLLDTRPVVLIFGAFS